MREGKTMTVREAARRLGIRLDALYSLVWVGRLAAEKQGNRWAIPVAAVEARLKSRHSGEQKQIGGNQSGR